MKVVVLKLETPEEEKRLEEFFQFIEKRDYLNQGESCNDRKESKKRVSGTRQKEFKEHVTSTEISIQSDKSDFWNVTNWLNILGIKTNLKGYKYIRETILKYLVEGETIFDIGVTKGLYPYLAKKFKTSPQKVERAIRNAIETTWEHGNKEIINNLFPNYKRRPTNSQFLTAIVDAYKVEKLEK